MNTKILILSYLIISSIIFSAYSQNSSEETDTTETDNFSSLMLNVSYTNNNMEYLTGTTEKLPIMFINGSYFHKSGVYFGGMYSKYFSDTLDSYEYDISAGYQKYFDNGFDFDLSYTWHKYNGDSLLEGINYNHSIDLMLGQEIGKFYISSGVNYKLGNTNNLFLDIGLSRFFQIDGIFSENDVLLINPGISASFGTDFWLYENMATAEKQTTFNGLNSAGYTYESFSYEAFNIFIPVSYGIKNVYLSASWLYKIPGAKYDYLGWEKQSGFMFSLTYFLNFTK